MGKVINMNGEAVEVVPLDEARTFFRGRNGGHMKRRSFLQMIYRKDKNGNPVIPKSAYTKTTKGNYWFDKNRLICFTENNTAA